MQREAVISTFGSRAVLARLFPYHRRILEKPAIRSFYGIHTGMQSSQRSHFRINIPNSQKSLFFISGYHNMFHPHLLSFLQKHLCKCLSLKHQLRFIAAHTGAFSSSQKDQRLAFFSIHFPILSLIFLLPPGLPSSYPAILFHS